MFLKVRGLQGVKRPLKILPQNNFAFCVHLSKYCFISQKSVDREKTSPKNKSEIFIYFTEIFLIIFSFHRVNLLQSRFV